jgi:hypothetical protein
MADSLEDVVDTAQEAAEGEDDWLISAAAVAIAVVATFMAVCGVKGDNVDYGILQEQSNAVDMWSMYQAKSMKQYMFELQRDSFEAQLALCGAGELAPEAREKITTAIAGYQDNIERYEVEKAEIKAEAEDHEKACGALDEVANKLDLADVFLAIAISLMAITILTKRRWLFVIAVIPCLLGIGLGLAALLNLPFSVPLPGFLA